MAIKSFTTIIIGFIMIVSSLPMLIGPVESKVIQSNPGVLTAHSTISIVGNANFNLAHGVVSGNGMSWSPWIIENWEIDGTGFTDGIYIAGTTNYFIIRNCTITNAPNGIFLTYVSNGVVTNNNITNTNVGINTDHMYGCLISDNEVYNANMCSIMTNTCFGNTINNNTVTLGGLNGIWIYSSNYNVVSSNYVSYISTEAVIIQLSYYNVILNNTIFNNSWMGLSTYTGYNEIYGNALINNPVNVYSISPQVNYWNKPYPICGNYYSDYAGVDLFSGPLQNIAGSDGIGDSSYTISPTKFDYFPLMEIPIRETTPQVTPPIIVPYQHDSNWYIYWNNYTWHLVNMDIDNKDNDQKSNEYPIYELDDNVFINVTFSEYVEYDSQDGVVIKKKDKMFSEDEYVVSINFNEEITNGYVNFSIGYDDESYKIGGWLPDTIVNVWLDYREYQVVLKSENLTYDYTNGRYSLRIEESEYLTELQIIVNPTFSKSVGQYFIKNLE